MKGNGVPWNTHWKIPQSTMVLVVRRMFCKISVLYLGLHWSVGRGHDSFLQLIIDSPDSSTRSPFVYHQAQKEWTVRLGNIDALTPRESWKMKHNTCPRQYSSDVTLKMWHKEGHFISKAHQLFRLSYMGKVKELGHLSAPPPSS